MVLAIRLIRVIDEEKSMGNNGISQVRTGFILQELFKVLISHPEGITAKDAIEAAAASVELTGHEKDEYETGGRRFDKMLRFATVDAVRTGWMRKNKGVWSITEDGRNALNDFPDPERFYREASRYYRRWRRAQDLEIEMFVDSSRELEAKIIFEEVEEQAWEEISSYLEGIDTYDLRELVSALLKAMDYHVSWIAPPAHEGDVDIIAWNDPLGTSSPRIKVRVKRQKGNIGAEELRPFLLAIHDDEVGLFITTGGFTQDAEELARSQEKKKITLIDRQKLVDLWLEYNDKLVKDKRYLLPLKPIYFLAPEN